MDSIELDRIAKYILDNPKSRDPDLLKKIREVKGFKDAVDCVRHCLGIPTLCDEYDSGNAAYALAKANYKIIADHP